MSRVDALRESIIYLVQNPETKCDLTARQLAVMLTCYHEKEEQTVRGLSESLGISKPSVSRSVERLVQAGLIDRLVDPKDRRSVLLHRTLGGKRMVDSIDGKRAA